MKRATVTDHTGAITQLRHDLDKLAADLANLADLRGAVSAQARALDDLTALTRRLTTGTNDAGPLLAEQMASDLDGPHNGTGGVPGTGDGQAVEEPAPAWLVVDDPAVAVAWLADLAVWVPAVWQPYLQTRTPDCWPWHPAVVAELLVARHQWADATLPDAGVEALAGWHDRWRPGAATRVTRAMAGCERAYGTHKWDSAEYVFDVAYLDELAHWWATTHGTDPTQPAPGLTPAGRR